MAKEAQYHPDGVSSFFFFSFFDKKKKKVICFMAFWENLCDFQGQYGPGSLKSSRKWSFTKHYSLILLQNSYKLHILQWVLQINM